MGKIIELDSKTIDQIAAGEVIERPASVVKELVENALDAGSTAITVEIRDGGKELIRVTDNGTGIARDDVQNAFKRHATSKLSRIEDLFTLTSLGFRGEALASIAAVSESDLITKTAADVSGLRYSIHGGEEKGAEEIGAPDGTTVLVRNLFYNTPARLKFLKSARAEAAHVGTLLEHLALSHPHVSFHLIRDHKDVLTTSGNGDLKEVIYRIFGRDIADSIVQVYAHDEAEDMTLRGFLGEPAINRSNRSFEIFFVNGRVVGSKLLQTALEEGCKPYLMQRRFPFAVLFLELPTDLVDVNAHPAKREVRFHEKALVSDFLREAVTNTLKKKEMIPDALMEETHAEEALEEAAKESAAPVKPVTVPEPFEQARTVRPYEWQRMEKGALPPVRKQTAEVRPSPIIKQGERGVIGKPSQMHLFGDDLNDRMLSAENRGAYRIIGQVFGTFWILEFRDRMYLVDQHAAHEKVNYERMMKRFRDRDMMSQLFNPPLIVQLTQTEENVLSTHLDVFKSLGFMVEPFGSQTFAIRGVPTELYGAGDEKTLFTEILDELADGRGLSYDPEAVRDRIAEMSCKASVKGNTVMKLEEFEALIDELLTLENPYNCPHGRPTIISMSRYEIDRKFKRVVS